MYRIAVIVGVCLLFAVAGLWGAYRCSKRNNKVGMWIGVFVAFTGALLLTRANWEDPRHAVSSVQISPAVSDVPQDQ